MLALISSEVDEYSLAQLGRAISNANRRDGVKIWRTFVRTRSAVVVREVRTQRIRIRPQQLSL